MADGKLFFSLLLSSGYPRFINTELYEDIYGQKNYKCVLMIGTELWNTSWKRKNIRPCVLAIWAHRTDHVRFALYNMTWHFHHVKWNNFVTGAGERDGNDEIALLFKTQATLLHRKSSSEITSTDVSASIRPFCGLWVQDDTDQMKRKHWRCTGQL